MRRPFTVATLLALVLAAQAQHIDINNSQNRTEDGYTPWVVGTSGQSTITVDGITIVATIDGTQENRTLKGEWWKDGVNKYSKLVSDGVGVYGLDANGNTPQLQSGEVGIRLTITGLSAGQHSILAYHNNPSGYNGPNLTVLVNGGLALSNVVQTVRCQTVAGSGQSYVRFRAEEGQPVEIVYRTNPDPNIDYTQGYNTTSLFLNALVFDRPNPLTTATLIAPDHQDMHANCDGGRTTLEWRPAVVATRHHLYMGTQPDALSLLASLPGSSFVAEGIDPMQTYYWRVDEEDQYGAIYEGDVWSFRPRRLAFPDAEGYGKYAIGGRGGTVYHVTSLADDATDPQPGTFRYGITRVSGPRTIVFDVAGTIDLKERLTCSDPCVTIAGQTAPGRGIMFTGRPFGMASDGITRFIRMRVGGGDDWDGVSPNTRTSDGLGMAGNDHSIMDHCSVSWTIDEAFSSRNAKNVTLQRTLISEALNRAGHKNYVESKGPDCEHGYAATIGGDRGSYHHNLLAHCEGRNWSLSGGLDGGGAYAGAHDVFNNVVYNWGSRATDGGTHNGQFVANYYKMGPATTKTLLLQADLEGLGTGTQEYYVSGNIRENRDGSLTQDALNQTYAYKLAGGQKLDWTVFVSRPYFESQAVVETAQQAYCNVLSDVGCNQPEADNHDLRMIQETLRGTTSTVGSRSGKKGLIDKESDAEGFQGLNIVEAARPEGWDTDQDGLPNWYEEVTGTDPATPNNNDDTDGNGYTDLEDYLEFLAHPHFFLPVGKALTTIDLKPFFAAFSDFAADEASWHSDGFSATATVSGTTLTVSASEPMVQSITVTVADKATGAKLSRTLFFCASSDASLGIPAPETTATARPAAVYNLGGRRADSGNGRKALVIEQGRKVVK